MKRAKKIPSLPDQKLGAAAIGQTVLRDFGVDGIVSGTVSAFRKEGVDEIYAIQYEDGDVEEIGHTGRQQSCPVGSGPLGLCMY